MFELWRKWPNLQFARFASGTLSRRWVLRQKVDPHSRKSKQEGYRSRAAYKLLEIDTKYKIFGKSTGRIVDLGFAPGAWTQVALEKCKRKPVILGVDLIPCSPPNGSHFLAGDIFSKSTHAQIKRFFERAPENIPPEAAPAPENSALSPENSAISPEKSPPQNVDLVLSDMMANTSGMKDSDHLASMDLCDGVLLLATELLRKDGSLVMKYYTGREERALHDRLARLFHRVFRFKPQASRSELREMYFVALRRKSILPI